MKKKSEKFLSQKSKGLFLLNYALFSLLIFSFSQQAVIKGKADKSYLALSDTIYLYTYSDYISYREKELAKSKIDSQGNFEIKFSALQPTFIFLLIDNARGEMVAEPGMIYQINFLPPDSDIVNAFGFPMSVEIEFNNSDEQELNFLLADFDTRYEAFMEYHRPLFVKKSSAVFGKIDTMKMLCNKKYSQYNSPYLLRHIEYTFASLEESVWLTEKKRTFASVSQNPVLFNHPGYMNFFHQFYSDVVKYFMNTKKMELEINSKQNFSSLMGYLSKSEFLANDTLREMAALKCLAEHSQYPSYKLNAVMAMLEQAKQQCQIEENRRAAENLIKKLSVMKKGSPVPEILFQDMNGKNKSLGDFKGKYVYLVFWASWCSSCIQELLLVTELKKKYEKKINFAVVSVDRKPETIKNFFLNNPKLNPASGGKEIFFLHCNNYRILKDEFNVLSVPAYYLISPVGNIFQSPAEKPQNIEPVFMQISRQ